MNKILNIIDKNIIIEHIDHFLNKKWI
jgi:hypothetical protein